MLIFFFVKEGGGVDGGSTSEKIKQISTHVILMTRIKVKFKSNYQIFKGARSNPKKKAISSIFIRLGEKLITQTNNKIN